MLSVLKYMDDESSLSWRTDENYLCLKTKVMRMPQSKNLGNKSYLNQKFWWWAVSEIK